MNWEPGRLGVSFCVGGVAHDVMRYEYQGTDFSLSYSFPHSSSANDMV
jgi:hypothetical protein